MRGSINDILDFISRDFKTPNVVVMPDFFMDRILDLDSDAGRFASTVNGIVERTGGSMDGVSQADQRGGNALNVASALLALGAKVTPIICTSKLGLEQIRFHLSGCDVDLSHIKIFSKASVTTALEFKTPSGKVNVMLRDVGSLADFGPGDLTEEDYALIEEADYVCLFNWAGTQKHGTRLIETVFRRAKAKGKCRTYLDIADPLPKEDEIPRLIERVLETDKVDILSLNENEAVTIASLLSSDVRRQHRKVEFNELALLSAQILAKKLKARIDLHTTAFAVTVKADGAFLVPAFRVKPMRATGAGDAWDAGNIIGDFGGLSDEGRLTMANAVSACYLSNATGDHPTRQILAKFLRGAASQ